MQSWLQYFFFYNLDTGKLKLFVENFSYFSSNCCKKKIVFSKKKFFSFKNQNCSRAGAVAFYTVIFSVHMNEMRVSVCHYLMYIRNPSTWLIQYICGVYRKSTLYHSKRNTEQRQMAKWKRNGNNNKKKTFKQQKTFCTYKNCIHARHIQHRVNVETAKHEESDGERAHSLYVYIIYCEVYTIEHAHMNGARICVKHTCRCVRLVIPMVLCVLLFFFLFFSLLCCCCFFFFSFFSLLFCFFPCFLEHQIGAKRNSCRICLRGTLICRHILVS